MVRKTTSRQRIKPPAIHAREVSHTKRNPRGSATAEEHGPHESATLRFVPLGGLEEVGRNCMEERYALFTVDESKSPKEWQKIEHVCCQNKNKNGSPKYPIPPTIQFKGAGKSFFNHTFPATSWITASFGFLT